MAETSAVVVGLLATVKTCVDLWAIITTTRKVNRDLEVLVSNLRTEQIRFLLWCQITEMHDIANGVEAESRLKQKERVTRRLRNQAPEGRLRLENLLLRPDAPDDFLRRHFESTMVGMHGTLKELESSLKSYGFLVRPSEKKSISSKTAAWFKFGARAQASGAAETVRTPGATMPLREIQHITTQAISQSTDPLPPEPGANLPSAETQPPENSGAKTAVLQAPSSFLTNINRGLKWSFQGKQNMVDKIAELRQFNNDLKNILDMLDYPRGFRLDRWYETAVVATTPVANHPTTSQLQPLKQTSREDLQEKWHRLEASRLDQKISALSRAAKRRAELRRLLDTELDFDPLDDIPNPTDRKVTGDALISDATPILNIRDIRFSEPKHTEIVERSNGSYDSRPVVIEWRYYSSQLSDGGRAMLHARIQALASTLRSCAQVSDFHVLDCKGIFHDNQLHHYGIVFASPQDTLPAFTLRDRLVEDFKNKIRQPLEARLRLACSLAKAVYQFFALGWLHKNIRSTSVLFFEPSVSPVPGEDYGAELPEPYLSGFGLSRQGNGIGTENLPSILKSATEQREWQLYVHPQRRVELGLGPRMFEQQSAQPESRAAGERTSPNERATSRSHLVYDTYGLGMMLLEVALWCPLVKLCSRSATVNDFQTSVWDTYDEKVAFNVGTRYANVVKWCLSGEEVQSVDEGSDRQADTQRFLEEFESVVITELEALGN